MELVEGHMLGKAFLPGGNLAVYELKRKPFQQFLVRFDNEQKAAAALFEYKAVLTEPKFVAHFGGYAGLDGGKPVFLFQKGPFLAGIAGLAEKDADAVARDFASRIR